MARRHRLRAGGDVPRRQPRRHGRRGVRGPPPGALRQADRDLGRPAARRLGHGDPPRAARAGARRPAQRRRRHRHEPRPADRDAHLPRPRRARFAVRAPDARARSPAGGRVPRSPRPPLRRALSGEDVPAAERGDRSRIDRRRAAAAAARAGTGDGRDDHRRRAGRHAVPVGTAGRAAPRAAGRRRTVVALEAGIALRPRRVPRGSGSPGGPAARRRRVRRGAARRGAAALRRRRRAAGARAADRHDRLRHRRPRAAGDDRSAARRRWPIGTACGSASRGSRCATSARIAARARRASRSPAARSTSSATPTSTSSSRWRAGRRWSRSCRRRWPPASPW